MSLLWSLLWWPSLLHFDLEFIIHIYQSPFSLGTLKEPTSFCLMKCWTLVQVYIDTHKKKNDIVQSFTLIHIQTLYIYIYIYIYIYTHTQTYTHTYIYIYIYMPILFSNLRYLYNYLRFFFSFIFHILSLVCSASHFL